MKRIATCFLFVLMMMGIATLAQKHLIKKSFADNIPQQQLDKFNQYLIKNLTYDKELREEHIHGQVIVAFKIAPGHKVKAIRIIKSPDTSLSLAAIALVKKSAPPALKKPGVTYVLPVFFKLNGGGYIEAQNVQPPVTVADISKIIPTPVYLFKEVSVRGYLGYPGQSVVMSEDSFARMNVYKKIDTLRQILTNYIKYPAIAREKLIGDNATLWFAINKERKIAYLKILSDPTSYISEEIKWDLNNTVFPADIQPGILYKLPLHYVLWTNEADMLIPPPSTNNVLTEYHEDYTVNPTKLQTKILDGLVIKGYVRKPRY